MQARTSNLSRNWPLLMLGLGLILFGTAVTVVLMGVDISDRGTNETNIGVVPMAVEYPAPELSLQGLDGEKHSLVDYRGQVVLVNNWATWCPPCKAEMPTLQAYYQKHQSDGFMLIAIEAGERESEVRQFVQEYGLTFPVWVDMSLRALNAFRNDNLPSSYVIDREGITRLTWTGPISEKMLEKYLTPLLED